MGKNVLQKRIILEISGQGPRRPDKNGKETKEREPSLEKVEAVGDAV